ncbi:hypothetical protein SCHPADRAFT_537606 [Schizopora paradoxa]|uniref:SET domain-containing protein n=1 Tax=Schizopora paradoxa TaxID=27342 RepID=A0A0H2RE52_9AGAM|nr:hypothetical protein SCHPADRAFT_537606 [Schizopora paradoxa]
MAIREPFYVGGVFSGPSKMPFVKVDSPSDIIFVNPDDPILRGVSWNGNTFVPASGQMGRPKTGLDWKNWGKLKFKSSRWFSSAICFTKCMELGNEVEVSRLNRSEIYLRMGWNNSAFHDAKLALHSGTLDDSMQLKAIVRMLKAQYAMGQSDKVLDMAQLRPEDSTIAEWVLKARKRKEDQVSGNFDWDRLCKEAKGRSYSPDIGDFVGPVEVGVRNGPIEMRGMFVTRDVKIGEILIFEKPIPPCYYKEICSAEITIHHGSRYRVVQSIVTLPA